MKLLLDTNQVVRAVDPEETESSWRGAGVLFPRDLDLQLLEVEAANLPEAVVGRYRYLDGAFVAIPLLEPPIDPPPIDPPPVEVPASVTMRQARLALLHAGLLDDVEAALAAIPDETNRRAAQIEWAYAQDVERASPWVQQLTQTLGLDAAMLDELFMMASQQ